MNHASRSPFAMLLSLSITAIVVFLLVGNTNATNLQVFETVKDHADLQYLSVSLSAAAYGTLEEQTEPVTISFPTAIDQTYELEMTRFEVIKPGAKFREGLQNAVEPNVILLRGHAIDEDNSTAFIALDPSGTANGYLTINGETWFLAKPVGSDELTIQQFHGAELPPFVEFCGVQDGQLPKFDGFNMALGTTNTSAGVRVAEMAIDGDEEFTAIFPSTLDAMNYATTLIGAVSDIYVRDINVKLVISFLRMWPGGGEPFSSYDVGNFRSYWINNEDTTGLNLVQLMSGHRDLSFGGIAYVAGTCDGYGYSIIGYLNGSFPTPVGPPNNSDWDIVVCGHEMGHNFGSGHTHDIGWYNPTIDDCGTTTPSRGTLLSYCHIWPGYTSNIDLRFHRRVQETIENYVTSNDCYWFDCNGNMIDDAVDIANLTSADVNSNGIPDECEDCNNNGILDDIDITGGTPDLNANGIPDECEPDCNSNGTLDEFEDDFNGNNIPDECEPDCNSNGLVDWAEISNGIATDYDRNTIPDDCQDCDGNSVSDWLDLEHQLNLFVADRNQAISEYLWVSGVPTGRVGLGDVSQAYDVTFGPDRLLYTASYANKRIYQTNITTGSSAVFYDGNGISMTPSALEFGADGHLYLADLTNNRVLKIDGATGSLIGIFVSAGSGGLTSPYALTFGPNGNLFVTSSTNAIIEYSSIDGSLVGTFVSAGTGGLSSPRGLVFKPDGNLLVTSYNTDQILEYDGITGAFVGVFNDTNPPNAPWGITIGPNGNVFVARTTDNSFQIMEYVIDVGRYYRSFVRRDVDLVAPGGLTFAPLSFNDCNGNQILDDCDIVSGVLHDANQNGIPDECDANDFDADGVPNDQDNCVYVPNTNQADADQDDIGDACDDCTDTDQDGYGDPDFPANTCPTDNCVDNANPNQVDTDQDGIGDACDDCTDTDQDGYGDPGYPDNTCPTDNCPGIANADQADADQDGIGDACDECTDTDNDGFGDPGFPNNTCPTDNCPTVANADQTDTDQDGVGDECDECTDTDNDGFGDPGFPNNTCPEDNCPSIANPDQSDIDQDGDGDLCDDDIDGDGVPNPDDNCPTVPNSDQADANQDQIGDVCCCINIRGNTNSDPEDKVNISDVTFLTDYLFGMPSGPAPGCPAEGNSNGDPGGSINIADVTFLIAYLFGQPIGPPPPACP